MNLLPCPFCGHTPTLIERFTVKCDVCDAEVNSLSPEANWNTRDDCWRPIEEAPKCGKSVIVWNGERVCEAIYESNPDDDGMFGWCESGFTYGGVLFSLNNVMKPQPTHFMPLPNPPKK